MYFLEERRNVIKTIKNAAGLGSNSCVMPHYTFEWKQIMVCKSDKPLREYIDSLPAERQNNYRILSNNRDDYDVPDSFR